MHNALVIREHEYLEVDRNVGYYLYYLKPIPSQNHKEQQKQPFPMNL